MDESTSNGLFDANGIYRRVNREPVLLLGGATALLMQVAHPKIAAAVTEHSEYRAHPLQRLYATVHAMQTIIFGDTVSAMQAVDRINDIHRRVTGRLREGTRRFPPGTPYAASEPELIVWVYATLTATTLNVYRELVRPLAATETAAFYEESKRIAQLFGASQALIPDDLEAFRVYLTEMIEGDELEITPTARSVAADIVQPRIPGFPRMMDDLVRVPALAFLPERLRERYGFAWNGKRRTVWSVGRRLIRRTLPLAPHRLRVNRHARDAERRRAY